MIHDKTYQNNFPLSKSLNYKDTTTCLLPLIFLFFLYIFYLPILTPSTIGHKSYLIYTSFPIPYCFLKNQFWLVTNQYHKEIKPLFTFLEIENTKGKKSSIYKFWYDDKCLEAKIFTYWSLFSSWYYWEVSQILN